MNIAVVGGRIIRNATVKGTDRKVLRFCVETRDGHDEGDNKERVNQVPCVLFGAAPELEQILCSGGQGLHVEFQGRIATWGDNNGKSGAEVVVFNRSVTFDKE
jgi:single-stranded DNA-binding protein